MIEFQIRKKITHDFSHRRSINNVTFFANSVTDHLLANIFFEGTPSGHTESNETGLKFVSCRGAEKKGGHTQSIRV